MNPELVTALRQEIVESQKSQAELLKWKLIATAAVAGAGLGIQVPAAAKSDARLLICLIPLICAYVDLLSLHIVVRIIVIAAFLRERGDEYEAFVHSIRDKKRNPFRFELMALHGSSGVISAIIFVFGVVGLFAGWDLVVSGAYTACGLIGCCVTWYLYRLFSGRAKTISDL